ncbi:MAG: hypothetical protein ACK5M3_08925 [Dysgonomonas sp.]
MNRHLLFFILLFPLFSFLSCSDEDKKEDTLNISTTQLNFKAEGGVQTFDIKTNGQWTIIPKEVNSEIKLNDYGLKIHRLGYE